MCIKILEGDYKAILKETSVSVREFPLRGQRDRSHCCQPSHAKICRMVWRLYACFNSGVLPRMMKKACESLAIAQCSALVRRDFRRVWVIEITANCLSRTTNCFTEFYAFSAEL